MVAVGLLERIDAGRAAVLGQVAFFREQFGAVASEWKADATRVTAADLAISEALFAALRRDFAEDDYCSEEASPLGAVLVLEAEFAWVLDPIDGTNNYALGNAACAISLALLRDGVPVYGFIYDYSADSLLEGGAGCGVSRDGRLLDREQAAADAQPMLGLHFPMDAGVLGRLEPLLEKYRVRCIGSGALTSAYVATGYLAGVADFRVKVWDIAAAYALCLGAGVRFEFMGASPFPLRAFHPEIDFCPYFAGEDSFFKELQQALGGSV